MMKEIKKENCCGCTACVQICPKKAIKFEYDEKGFGYPIINRELCIDCGLCDKVCQFKERKEQDFQQKFYAAKSCNNDERIRSRSGGVFFTLAKQIIRKAGVVYGVILDDAMNVRFDRAISIDDCKKMQGSKYVESNIEGIYTNVKKDLLDNRYVLFSGTACQVAGLYGFLGNINIEKLYTIDIVCHGVTSTKIYHEFVRFIEKKYNGKMQQFNFRDKYIGWDTHVESYIINQKKIFSRYYTRLFYSNAAMRPSCSVCPFANFNRPADMTIADFWGLRDLNPEFDDNKGVSVIILNNEKGKSMLKMISDGIEHFQVSKEDCVQPNLERPTPKAKETDEFWKVYMKSGIKGVLKKYGGYDWARRVKWKILDLPKLLR